MKKIAIYLSLFCIGFSSLNAQKIDRKKVVQRHNVVNTKADTLSTLTVGNGKFAYTVDITGMQSISLNPKLKFENTFRCLEAFHVPPTSTPYIKFLKSFEKS